MGLLDRFGGDDDERGSGSDALDGPNGSASGGMGFGGDDADDGLDFGGDDFDDDFDDGFDLDEGGGLEGDDDSSVREIESRVAEVESELASVSSTMSTVRSENEEIASSVQEVEENVRKLLDIYEMVTRGVNPFVDDVGSNGAFTGEGFGLFDGGGQAATEELDADVADADAESFFDEEALDDMDDEPVADDLFAEDAEADGETGDELMEDTTDDGDARSFDELKAEYESGAVDWDGEPNAATGGGDDLEKLFDDADADEASEAEEDPDTLFEDAERETESATDDGDAGGRDATGDAAMNPESVFADAPNGMESKPYLESIPAGYVGDLVVLEWLEYLVECADAADAARALAYYETIEWIAPEAGDHLRAFLSGFGEFDPEEVVPAPKQLSMDNHVTSLQFIGQLGGSATDATTISRWTGADSEDPAKAAAKAARDTVAGFDGDAGGPGDTPGADGL